MDKELLHKKIQVERKIFFLSLRENPRGRVLRLTEDVGGRRDTIMIPATGLESIRDAIDEAIAIHARTPPDKAS